MLVQQLQHELEGLYELETGHDVGLFLCSDPSLLPELVRDGKVEEVLERLLLSQQGDTVDVSLYLHQKLLDDLKACDPRVSLTRANMDQFWVALEGVSHFVYFIWNCLFDRPVSLLEMELQAEVDKFVLSLHHLTRQDRETADLHNALFERVHFLPQKDDESRDRYRTANDQAARYCRWLQQRFIRRGQFAAVTNEIRRFYRIPHRRKLDYIDALEF